MSIYTQEAVFAEVNYRLEVANRAIVKAWKAPILSSAALPGVRKLLRAVSYSSWIAWACSRNFMPSRVSVMPRRPRSRSG